jgi:arsenate reductase
MAEGWARHPGAGQIEALSAGIEAHGKNPLAIRVMHAAGIDISGQESTRLTDEMLASTDYLVTVCGHADENCPVLPAGIRKEHWPLDDPAKATGSDDEVIAVFRECRDDIGYRVEDLLVRLKQDTRKQSDEC